MPDANENQVGEEQVSPAAESTPAAAGGTATEGRQASEDEAPTAPATKAARKAPATKAARKAPAKKTTTRRAPAPKAAAAPDESPTEADPAAADPAAADPAAADPAAEDWAAEDPGAIGEAPAPARKTAAKKTTAKRSAGTRSRAKKATAEAPVEAGEAADAEQPAEQPKKAAKKTAKKTAAKKSARKSAAQKAVEAPAEAEGTADQGEATEVASVSQVPVFQAPVAAKKTSRARKKPAPVEDPVDDVAEAADEDVEVTATQGTADEPEAETTEGSETAEDAEDQDGTEDAEDQDGTEDADEEGSSPARRRRRRGGRRRRRGGSGGSGGVDTVDSSDTSDDDRSSDSEDGETDSPETDSPEGDSSESDGQAEGSGSSRRRRRRRRSGDGGGDDSKDDPTNTVTRVRGSRTGEDQITALSGSTRLEAKKQRRREGREAGRRRAPIVSEAEFLARRESVERVMVIREREGLTQIGVLEDKVLVEHYVARESQTSLIGNVYLGRVQNVLPSMEAAFIDIGKGRNAVLYAGEVNWSALGHKDGQPRKIESVLSSGQSVLVQVTKDPVGHKGARLTSQISLAGRFLVYVPDGTTSGISRKLPDTERSRLKTLLKEIVPDTAGVIVRTAAEGASEEELTRDVERLKARWEDIEKKAKGSAPQLLYGEPDLTLKVVRDLFTEDFATLVIQGDDAWETVQSYVTHMAPDLADRLERFEPAAEGRDAGKDLFAAYRVDEQIAKGLDRKVWLPSGGSLVIDRTEAMTVVDVNTGKFTGSGGNLEETVTKNNLEAAEEIVRQLRLRDIGGIIVVDFIDMVLESNRDLVLRRLVECLGRDRTRHQVAEVTSLGLVQMTRKRIGTGLLEAFSETCTHCQGRGLVVHEHPVQARGGSDDDRGGRGGGNGGVGKRSRGARGKGSDGSQDGNQNQGGSQISGTPSPKDIAAIAAIPRHEKPVEQAPVDADEEPAAPGAEGRTDQKPAEQAPPAEVQVAEAQVAEAQVVGPQVVEAPAEASLPEPEVPETPEPEQPARREPLPEPAHTPAASSGVVTRTRRAARRTGPLTTGEGAAVVVEASLALAPEQPVQSATPAPKVVTRTRSSRSTRAGRDG